MEQLAPAKLKSILQIIDDLFEAVRGERHAVEEQQPQLPQHIARAVSGKHNVCIHPRKNFPRLIAEDQTQELRKLAAFRNVRPQNCRRMFAPCALSLRSS